MKTTIATVFALAGAAFVAATDFPADMPECAKRCGTDMLGKATEFGCDVNDVACICRDQRFGFGVHDCSVESCADVSMANAGIVWGNNLCSSAGETSVVIPTATAVGSGAATGSPVTTSEVVSTITSGDSTIVTTSVTTISDSDDDSNDGDDATAITTSTWTSVITSDDATSTVTGETTISGVDGVPDASSTPETTTSPIVSTHIDETTTFETTVGSSTFVPDQSSDAADESTSTGLGAQVTAAPALGFMAAAGIAAALL